MPLTITHVHHQSSLRLDKGFKYSKEQGRGDLGTGERERGVVHHKWGLERKGDQPFEGVQLGQEVHWGWGYIREVSAAGEGSTAWGIMARKSV